MPRSRGNILQNSRKTPRGARLNAAKKKPNIDVSPHIARTAICRVCINGTQVTQLPRRTSWAGVNSHNHLLRFSFTLLVAAVLLLRWPALQEHGGELA